MVNARTCFKLKMLLSDMFHRNCLLYGRWVHRFVMGMETGEGASTQHQILVISGLQSVWTSQTETSVTCSLCPFYLSLLTFHRTIGSLRLEKITKITKSKHWPIPAMLTNPCPSVPYLHSSWTSRDRDSTISLGSLCQCWEEIFSRLLFSHSHPVLSSTSKNIKIEITQP